MSDYQKVVEALNTCSEAMDLCDIAEVRAVSRNALPLAREMVEKAEAWDSIKDKISFFGMSEIDADPVNMQDRILASEALEDRDKEIERLTAELTTCRQESDAEMEGLLKLREECGAKDNECFPNFVHRLYKELTVCRQSFEGMDDTWADMLVKCRERAESAEAQLTELQAKHTEAIHWLNEASYNLHHTCFIGDALQCLGCSLEARIDAVIDSAPQSVKDLLAVLEAAEKIETGVTAHNYFGQVSLHEIRTLVEAYRKYRKWIGEKP